MELNSKEFIEVLYKKFLNFQVNVYVYGCVIGSHGGPKDKDSGCTGICVCVQSNSRCVWVW